MRPVILLVSAVSLVAMGGAIVAGGRAVSSNEAGPAASKSDAGSSGLPHQVKPKITPLKAVATLDNATQTGPEGVIGHAPMLAAAAHRTRSHKTPKEEPTIGDVSIALSPMQEQDRPRVLYRPRATETGTIDAMGYTLILMGVNPPKLNEKCVFNGRSWPCGVHALSEFRSWLRDRAVTCLVPAQPAGRAVLTRCSVGRDDAGAWLVKNGWARAEAAGPYVKAGEKARAERLGIYGQAPWLKPRQTALPRPVKGPAPLPQPELTATPPTDLSAPSQ
jgi:endonuclease YncB( thermonuclease family)